MRKQRLWLLYQQADKKVPSKDRHGKEVGEKERPRRDVEFARIAALRELREEDAYAMSLAERLKIIEPQPAGAPITRGTPIIIINQLHQLAANGAESDASGNGAQPTRRLAVVE